MAVAWKNSNFRKENSRLLVAFIVFLVTPIFILTWLLTSILHFIVILSARLFRPDLKNPLAVVQANMALEPIHTKPEMNIIVYLMLDAPVTLGQVRSTFHDRILCCANKNGQLVYPELKQRKETYLNYSFWKEDENFDLNNHVRTYDYHGGELWLPEKFVTETNLERVTGGLLAQPWKKGQSPWELLIIHSYGERGNGTVLLFRLHHSMGDGFSISKLLQRLGDNDNMKTLEPTFPKLTITQRCLAGLTLPFRALYYIAVQILENSDTPHSWHLTHREMSRQYNTCFVQPVAVETVKQIKNKYGVNYNAVLGAVTLAGIRKLMEDGGQEVPPTLGVFVPIPLPSHPGGLVMHAAGMYMKCPLKPALDGGLKEINAEMNGRNAAGQLLATNILLGLGKHYPECLLRLSQNCFARCTLSFSSFPGPQQTTYVLGHVMSDVMFCFGLPVGDMGASATLLSYAGNQRLVFTVDKTIYGSREKLRKLSHYVYAELETLLLKGDCNGSTV